VGLEQLPSFIDERIVPDLLQKNVRLYPKKVALIAHSNIYGDHSLTYQELNDESARLAKALYKKGIRKGDRIGILLENTSAIEAHITYHAAHKIGAINVPLNTRYVARELAYVVQFSNIKALVFGPQSMSVLSSIKPEISTQLFLEVSKNPSLGESFYDFYFEEEKMDQMPLVETDDADWIFTSGTTGNPKAVALTHANSVACGYQSKELWGITDKSIYQNSAPFYTSTGIHTNLLACLAAGCTYVIEPEFHAFETLKRIEKYKTTSIYLISGVIQLIFDRVDLNQIDISSLTRICYGGQMMSKEFYEKVESEFGEKRGIELVHLYGLTEGGTCGTMLLPEEHRQKVKEMGSYLLSIGKQGFNDWIKIRIVNENDHDVKPLEMGEICLRSPSVMSRYVDNPDATNNVLQNGWLHTGDIGTIDEKGFIYYIDRIKQMIRRGGLNISSAEIEGILMEHPAIQENAVIPIPNPILGQEVKAVVVLKPNQQATEKEIIQYCRKYLSDYKVPVQVEFLDKLPRNAMGRVLKGILKGEQSSLQA
jgi:acyl-CoA synthetase (AMP-forming)/AMP-acid ligase II